MAFCDIRAPLTRAGWAPRIPQVAHEQRVPDADMPTYLATQNSRVMPILGVGKSGRVVRWGDTQVHEGENPSTLPWVTVT